ncbi:opioid growth factor receptor [Calypte anna]|uniref:opioid growth factor receptor n=1 Tax=Calypte anna TaxID=9244 RepID=UPI0011C37C0B|nr:opioid growth factor receptor [Calypte anna]
MASRCSFWAEDEANCCSYDSTWDEDEEDEDGGEEESEAAGAEAAAGEEPEDAGEQPVQSWVPSSWQAQYPAWRNWHAAEDLQRYRHHYPGLKESEDVDEEEMWNLNFYKNEIQFLPRGLHIETLLETWWDNYEVLEQNHSYIQWLFPLRERGVNLRARQLTCQEIQAFKKSEEVMQRFVRAYQLMLRFYGIDLVNKETGELKRAENWAERFRNLNRYSHNNLRITRILKCLGEMGYEHYQYHLVKFFLRETLVEETLPNVKRSALDYFLFTLRSKQKRRELVHYAWQHFKPRSEFVWGPQDKLLKYRPHLTKSQLHQKAEDKQETPGKNSDDSVEKDQNQSPAEEQKAGDAVDLVPGGNDGDVKEKPNECPAKGGDGEEEQQEEKDLNSEAEEVLGMAENDCTKESKKRKLGANMADSTKSAPLKSPPDIEKISRNLGECAIDAEITSSGSLVQAEEDQEPQKEDNANTKDSAVPEASDATAKRRRVDKRPPRNKCSLAINLSMGLSASSANLNPSVTNSESEKENVCEKNATVEAPSEKGEGNANGVGSLEPAKGLKTGRTSPINSGLESSGDEVPAKNDQHHCSSPLLGGKDVVDGVEQPQTTGNESGKGEAEVTDKKQVLESVEQNMASSCPEEDSAEATKQKPESSEHAAEPSEEQVAAE